MNEQIVNSSGNSFSAFLDFVDLNGGEVDEVNRARQYGRVAERELQTAAAAQRAAAAGVRWHLLGVAHAHSLFRFANVSPDCHVHLLALHPCSIKRICCTSVS